MAEWHAPQRRPHSDGAEERFPRLCLFALGLMMAGSAGTDKGSDDRGLGRVEDFIGILTARPSPTHPGAYMCTLTIIGI